MAGHSKWSQIKHKKAVVDQKRSKEFSKLARLITVESRLVGGDVQSPNLKKLIEKAKQVNMPKENIERAVQKGVGGASGELVQVVYELYGPGGVAILISTITDSTNRTVQELKHLVSTHGYTLAEPGSALWAFAQTDGRWQPTTTIPLSEDDVVALHTLVNALNEHEDVQEVITNATSPLV